MGCCKCEEFRKPWISTSWEDETENPLLDVIWEDADGNGYCIFHAPSESPEKQDVEEFNQLVYERIREAKEEGRECILSGVVFPGDIYFSCFGKDNPLPECGFASAHFEGWADFESAHFKERANFRSAHFERGAYFQSAHFEGWASFQSAHFEGVAYFVSSKFVEESTFRSSRFFYESTFAHASFQKHTIFDKSIYHEPVTFSEATFSSVSFDSCHFYYNVNMIRCTFNDTVNFTSCFCYFTLELQQAKFHEDSNFSHSCYSEIDCFRVDYKGKADFTESTVGHRANLHRASFDNNAWFDNFRCFGKADFQQASFTKYAQFRHAQFHGEALFTSTHFTDGAFFENTEFFSSRSFSGCLAKSPIIMNHVDMGTMPMAQVSVESFRFVGCEWPKKAGRRVIHEELAENSETNPRDKEETYRRLKKLAIEEKDFGLASDWHFNEKYWKLKREKRPITWTRLYYIFSGFGERSFPSLCWLLIFMLWPLLLLSAMQQGWITDPLADDGVLGHWLHFLPFIKAAKLNLAAYKDATWLIPLMALSQILISVQAALFGLALRNRLRR